MIFFCLPDSAISPKFRLSCWLHYTRADDAGSRLTRKRAAPAAERSWTPKQRPVQGNRHVTIRSLALRSLFFWREFSGKSTFVIEIQHSLPNDSTFVMNDYTFVIQSRPFCLDDIATFVLQCTDTGNKVGKWTEPKEKGPRMPRRT